MFGGRQVSIARRAIAVGAAAAAGMFLMYVPLMGAPPRAGLTCEKALVLLHRREKQLEQKLTRLRNGIRDLKGTRGALTPGGKRRLYRLERQKEEMEKHAAKLRSARTEIKQARKRAKARTTCRISPGLLPKPVPPGKTPGKKAVAKKDRRALASARKKKIAAARARIKEIDGEVARVRGILEKYRKRKTVHRRFKRRIHNYRVLIRRLRAEQADLLKKVAPHRPKSRAPEP